MANTAGATGDSSSLTTLSTLLSLARSFFLSVAERLVQRVEATIKVADAITTLTHSPSFSACKSCRTANA